VLSKKPKLHWVSWTWNIYVFNKWIEANPAKEVAVLPLSPFTVPLIGPILKRLNLGSNYSILIVRSRKRTDA